MLTDLNNAIGNMMKAKDIALYKIEVEGNSEKGDGYLGEVTFVTVKTSKKDYNLVIKTAKKSDELRKQTPIKEVYDREIYFYNKLAPVLEEFQSGKALENPFSDIPKCYAVLEGDKKEALVLENLKSIGYEVHDRKKSMNLNHIKFVFTEYGRFHGLSLALRHKNPSLFKTVTKSMTNLMGKLVIEGRLLNVFYNDFKSIKKLLEKDQEFEAVKKYKNFEKDFQQIFANNSSESNHSSAILHGDCWNNNFMFTYDKDNNKTNPTGMRFLDFQLSRVGSPIYDLSYFLYSCADKQVLKDFDYLLQVYHSSLSDYLQEFGLDVDEIFPFKKLKEDWKEFAKFGLLMSTFVVKISLCDSDEAPDFAESAEQGGDFEKSFNFVMKNQGDYERRMKDVFLHVANKFL